MPNRPGPVAFIDGSRHNSAAMRSLMIVVVLLSACGKGSEPPPPSSGSPNAKPESGPSRSPAGGAGGQAGGAAGPMGGHGSQAEAMFATVCVTCHGADGSGRGPAAEALNPKPRNYTDPQWQASVTDDQIKEIILKGGQGVGKSPMMPGQPQLADQPEVLDGLVKIIRAFGKHP
jgi:mono/diheme cytochrome c family protein